MIRRLAIETLSLCALVAVVAAALTLIARFS